MTKKMMKASVVAASVLLSVSVGQAADIKPFGYAGLIGNFGFGNGNTLPGESVTGYLGVSANVGVEFGFSGLKLGVGMATGFAPLTLGAGGDYTSNAFVSRYDGALYKRPFVELSDLYLGYEGGGLNFLFGRYNANKILKTADWIGGNNQGLAFAYDSSYFGVWATWVNDFLRNGYNASANINNTDGRYGMNISGMGNYASSWNNFNLRNELFAAGVDVKIGEYFSLNPYMQYWLRDAWTDTIQAGARLAFSFNAGPVKSTTTGRFLWSNNTSGGANGFMWQADQEFIFVDMVKLGGGYLSIGRIGLGNNSIVDRTRFYGQYLYPTYYSYNGTGLSNRSYLNGGVDTWYVFTGFKMGEQLDLDILYAGGDYEEFSTILNYNIIGGGEDTFTWSVGGGYVTNGFRNAHTALVYTKVKF